MLAAETVAAKRASAGPVGQICDRTFELGEVGLPWNAADITWMKRAIALARGGEATPGKNPIGCVIVCNGNAIGEACNEVDLRRDATAHAEILSMRPAGEKLQNKELRDAVLYTTLQPCGMCTMASIWAKIGRIVYGAGRDDVHGVSSGYV
ncbi:nucleoside deaminase [Acidisphaera sp. S103]|uniref:nucleoside deaminase n=1 Tax=Acidisphaera sp. S103 TaxID=1747223 RepID=UPI00131E81AF|nr:nucleoside deaminase [Acidisphaera sp. S103]